MGKKPDLSFIDKIEELGAEIAIVKKLTPMLDNVNTPTADIAKVIELDQSITSFVLKLANSPLYPSRRKKGVSTVREAVDLIGFWSLKSILRTYFLRNLFAGKSFKKKITKVLWEHSVDVALFSRSLAKFFKMEERKIEEAYFAGLIHDIGKLVIYFHAKEDYENIFTNALDEQKPILPKEEKLFGYSHVDTGYYLLSKWKLPELYRESVRFHHNFEEYPGSEEIVELVTISNDIILDTIDNVGDIPASLVEKCKKSGKEINKFVEETVGFIKGNRAKLL